jgi:hypothetical protein
VPRQLVYVSGSAAFFTAADLDAILTTSRRRNPAEGVTGLLLFHDGNFFQVLEGPAQAVGAVYERILRDPRHHHPRALLDRETPERTFGDWSMGFLGYSELAPGAREAFLGLRGALDTQRVGPSAFGGDEALATLARRFVESFRELGRGAEPDQPRDISR